jgi:hypothetical protein
MRALIPALLGLHANTEIQNTDEQNEVLKDRKGNTCPPGQFS